MIPLDVSPVATFLVGLSERRASGCVTLVSRTLHLVSGEVGEISVLGGDPSFGEFLVQSERLGAAAVSDARSYAARTDVGFESALIATGRLTKPELKALLRACRLDRFVRELRSLSGHARFLPTLDATQRVTAHAAHSAPLLPFVLDAWTRLAAEADAAAVGMRIDYRLAWVDGPLLGEAQRWASLPDVLDRPVVSTVLGRVPAAAAEIAALVRAGFVKLIAPGAKAAPQRSRKDTLPPPPPRLLTLADVATLPSPSEPPSAVILALSSAPPPAASPYPSPHPIASLPPVAPAPGTRTPAPLGLSIPPPSAAGTRLRAPRLQYQPGGAGAEIEPIPEVKLPVWPSTHGALEDPLRELELKITQLEERSASPRERARAFIQLAALWQTRIGSLEQATRLLREAAAADPDDTLVLLQTARQCGAMGQLSLALAYARAVAFTAGTPAEHAAGHRTLADLHLSHGNIDHAVEALSEAAAEDPDNPEPHELLAQLHYERGNGPLAVAHAVRAATGYAGAAPKRSLGWRALAYVWDPSDPLVSLQYRDALAASGQLDAAVAVSAETARNVRDVEQRRSLRLATAEFARTEGRTDLAAELMIEVFDEDPSFAPAYELLDGDWARGGLELEHLAVIESIVRACPTADKARWYGRYARLRDGAPPLEELAEQLAELEARANEVAGSAAERTVLNELCGLHLVGGDLQRAVSCALRLYGLEPAHRLAAARLWRAAALLKDGALSREASTWLARAQTGDAQARSLANLARQQELLGDFDAALECAEATLASQPAAADAAIVVLRHAHRLAPPRAAAVLASLRPLLDTCPPLSLMLAEAARAAGAREQALQAMVELNTHMPLLYEPLVFILDLQLAGDDPAAVLAAALALLACSQEPSHVARVEAAVLRLVELGSASGAARLAQHILDARCRADVAYATSAAELARTAAEPELLTFALERVVSMRSGARQIESLIAVADHHRLRGDRTAEVRAWLRVLSLAPGHAGALEHLTRLFAESSDLARLLVVLSIGLESSTDAPARRKRLLEMASAAAAVGGERERAAQYVAQLLAESVEDPPSLRIGVGALFALGDDAWAIERAKHCCEALPHEAAAAIYLWLAHRAETVQHDSALALELAAEGARRFPASGALLLMAERLSLSRQDRDTAKALYADLIADAIGEHGRRALAYRAGRWLERTGSYDEALERYQQAFELARSTGVAYKALERVARASHKLLPLAQAQETLAELAGDDRSRMGLLRDAARTSLVDLNDPERGFRNLLKADAIAPVGELDHALRDAAKQLGERDQPARERALLDLANAREARAQQLWEADPKAKLLLNAARVHLHERHDPEASAKTLAPLLDAQVTENLSTELQAEGFMTLAEAQLGAGRPAEALRSVERVLSVAPGTRHAMELKAKLSTPPPAPPTPSVRVFQPPVLSDQERRALALERLRNGSIEATALRELHAVARDEPLGSVAAQLLSVFDPTLQAATAAAFRADSMLPEEAAKFVHGESDTELRSLQRMLWECVRAIPQLRRSTENFALDPGLRATVEDRVPVVATFHKLARLFELDNVELYLRASANPSLEVLPTHPPCIVAYAKLAITPLTSFRLAQSLVFAEPEHAVTCVLPEAEGKKLIAALLGAFGPPGSAGELSQADKDLASQLWHAVPVRVQAQFRELVRAKLPLLAYDRLRRDALQCGHRAGLLASRDVRSAVESVIALQPELSGIDPHKQTGFELICQSSAGVRELIRAALSDAYLSLAGLRAA